MRMSVDADRYEEVPDFEQDGIRRPILRHLGQCEIVVERSLVTGE